MAADDLPPFDPTSHAAVIAGIVANLTDAYLPVREATLAYRDTLVAQNVGADIADQMARDFHGMAAEYVKAIYLHGLREQIAGAKKT